MSSMRRLWIGTILIAALTATAMHAEAGPANSPFTYQGELTQNGVLVDALGDFQFSLWNAPSGPVQIGGTVALNGVAIVAGRFTVDLDFGAGVFGTDERWLEIAVRVPAGTGSFTTLSPRQLIAGCTTFASAIPLTRSGRDASGGTL